MVSQGRCFLVAGLMLCFSVSFIESSLGAQSPGKAFTMALEAASAEQACEAVTQLRSDDADGSPLEIWPSGHSVKAWHSGTLLLDEKVWGGQGWQTRSC